MYVIVTTSIVKSLIDKETFDNLGEDGIQAILNYTDEVYHFAGEMPILEEEDFYKWTRYESIKSAAEEKNISIADCVVETRKLYDGSYWNELSLEEQNDAVIDYMREHLIEQYECLILDNGAVLIRE